MDTVFFLNKEQVCVRERRERVFFHNNQNQNCKLVFLNANEEYADLKKLRQRIK
jgi:hypothetical protein